MTDRLSLGWWMASGSWIPQRWLGSGLSESCFIPMHRNTPKNFFF